MTYDLWSAVTFGSMSDWKMLTCELILNSLMKYSGMQ